MIWEWEMLVAIRDRLAGGLMHGRQLVVLFLDGTMFTAMGKSYCSAASYLLSV